MKRASLRPLAEADVARAFSGYLVDANERVAGRFLAAVDAALKRIERRPGAGSPRYGVLLDLPGLRAVLVRKFPWVIFYVERPGAIDVGRVLHQHSDIPAALAGES